jgi:hypothetical protein
MWGNTNAEAIFNDMRRSAAREARSSTHTIERDTKTVTTTTTNGRQPVAKTPVSNDGSRLIEADRPYVAVVKVRGVAPILFHRWSCEAVGVKAGAPKGSQAKKTDDLESYVYRCDEDGTIGIPGIYLVGSITDKKNGAAKSRQDPRSPRKSALDLYRAGVVPLTICASLGTDKWDFEHQARVVVQQSAITRIRPGFHAGWEATFELQVLAPEYIKPSDLHECLNLAGRLVGIGDFRPTYGRFLIASFEVSQE